MVDDGPKPMDSISGIETPLATDPKTYCMQYLPAITCERLSGWTSGRLSDASPEQHDWPTRTIGVEASKCHS